MGFVVKLNMVRRDAKWGLLTDMYYACESCKKPFQSENRATVECPFCGKQVSIQTPIINYRDQELDTWHQGTQLLWLEGKKKKE